LHHFSRNQADAVKYFRYLTHYGVKLHSTISGKLTEIKVTLNSHKHIGLINRRL
jgi:hypothetical protein